MRPQNTLKKPNLVFVLPTFNIIFPKKKKNHLLEMNWTWKEHLDKVGYNYI